MYRSQNVFINILLLFFNIGRVILFFSMFSLKMAKKGNSFDELTEKVILENLKGESVYDDFFLTWNLLLY